MSMEDLFTGAAVVIDDEVHDPSKNINKIIDQIESAYIPVLKYSSLPENEFISHFRNLSFLLLDWDLVGVAGVSIPDSIINENIEFITELNKACFCPIFIFTNEATETIKTRLIEEGLISDGKPSNIFILSKSDLQADGSMFSKINEWLKSTPSVYVLKEWEKEYHNCKTKLFSELHSIHPSWPTVMWKNFEADGANKSLEMGELISRNLHSRMTPFEFKNDILEKDTNVPRDELRKVLEGERFLKSKSLHKEDLGTGDLFKDEYQDNDATKVRYYLNIRAQCDLVREKSPKLFLLSGYILEQKQNGKIQNISFNQGQYLEKPNHAVVAFLDGGKIIEFKFDEFSIRAWSGIKTKRIGRLLPPYINKIQQRYSLYMQRQGLSRIPDAAIFEATSNTGGANE